MAKLKEGITILTTDGEQVTVGGILGEGGQGIVYRVSYQGKDRALKWYAKGVGSNPERFWRNVHDNIKHGSPAPLFLWPLAITNMDADGCFGYVMEIRPEGYRDFDLFLLNRVQFSSFSAIIRAAMQITAGFRRLHNMGLSYQDLNDGNFFVKPETGEVLICDNDNVAQHGSNLGIQGKPKYMAPEVVSLAKLPDIYSDRFSLAVILFLLLFRDHPLAGRADNPNANPEKNEMRLYCTNPVFIFDPKDESNRPDPQVHRNALLFWPLYPSGIRRLFIRAFSGPLMDSTGGPERQDRVTEKEWLRELSLLRDQLVRCPSCGEKTFFDPEDETHECMNCGGSFARPPLLRVAGRVIPLQPGRKLLSYELEQNAEPDVGNLDTAAAGIVQNKNNPSVWGLRNLTQRTWHKITPSGKDELVPPGSVVPVARGLKIDVAADKTTGVIE